MKSKVALVACPDYRVETLKKAISRGVRFFGGWEGIFSSQESVLLKPNLLVGENPKKAVNTHPHLLQAVAELLVERGQAVGFGDSPGFGSAQRAAQKAGYEDIAKKLGLSLADFQSHKLVPFPDGMQQKSFSIARGVLAYDAILSLPKWKTHGLTRVTGAIKNQFGCVPGLLKSEFHFQLPDTYHFSRMLVDLTRLLRPHFFIVDAIVAMEGNGPRAGRPIELGLLALGMDPVALDATLSRVIDLEPQKVPTCVEGEKGELGFWQKEKIELVGDDFSLFFHPNFKVERGPLVENRSNPLFKVARGIVLPRPAINGNLCQKCGVCVDICPSRPKSLDWKNKKDVPRHRYHSCIRCFCCQEMCPYGAITVETPLFGRLIGLGRERKLLSES
ncbi:MAG: hypothetical protein PWP04_608 [Candidatus Atribacteria bacterium]|nr:hypothetical protein [Candidatus Atribacteria bacterium]